MAFNLIADPMLGGFESRAITRCVLDAGAARSPRVDLLHEHSRSLDPRRDRVPHDRIEFVAPHALRGASLLGAPFQSIGVTAVVVGPRRRPGRELLGVRLRAPRASACARGPRNVVGLPGSYDTDQGRKQLRVPILFARAFLLDVLDGRFDAEDPPRAVLKLNERIFRFAMHDRHAKELYQTRGVDPADAIVDDARLPAAFREKRLPQMREQLATRTRPVLRNGG